jgi:hypothetical protein
MAGLSRPSPPQMGLKPTQYRCASESLLRRFRIQGSLLTAAEPGFTFAASASYARAATVSIPVCVSRACSASWVGFGWPARPR